MSRTIPLRIGLLCALAASALALQAAPALGADGPKWRLNSVAAATVEPGGVFGYSMEAGNFGDTPTNGSSEEPITMEVVLPPGLSALDATAIHASQFAYSCAIENGADPLLDPSKVLCQTTASLPVNRREELRLKVAAAPTATGLKMASFKVSGGGAASVTSVDPTSISAPRAFGIDAFDGLVSANRVDTASTQAGGHPYSIATSIDFNSVENTAPLIGGPYPIEAVRDVFVDLPPGSLGSVSSVAHCTLLQLSKSEGTEALPNCLPASQVGTTTVRIANPSGLTSYGPVALYSLDPPPGAPARFGFNVLSTVVVLDAYLRTDGDYGLTVASRNIPEGLAAVGTTVTFWGVPADPSHELERACPNEGAPGLGRPYCPSPAAPVPFLRNPTSCTATPSSGLTWSLHMDSWVHPGALSGSDAPDLSDPAWKSASYDSHRNPGYPHVPSEWGEGAGIDGCGKVPFNPGFSAEPTTNAADSPSGLDVHLTVPQECWEHYDQICQSDLKDAAVKLPTGMSLNPSAADGLGACTPQQIGLSTPVGTAPAHFSKAPANCPNNSKIGDVTIETPLLEEPLNGAVYLAQQSQNPFNSLLAMYLVAEGSGVVVKQAGEIEAGPGGRLTTRFIEAPQTPFSDLHVSLYGGPRGTLRTPPTCGIYASQATLAPWSGNPAANVASLFEITNCPNSGFDPHLDAGTRNPLAGTFSPFNLRLTRADGTQEFASLKATLPEGLLAKLAGVGYCSDSALAAISGALGAGAAQAAQPSCPASSLLGTLTAGAGAGPTPFFTERGRLYFSGPYKGAPYSLAAVVPALAGPFDLGTVVVKNALRVDPETTRVTVDSDPFPQSLHGIPLDLRDLRVDVSRPDYTLNPTSCDAMSIDATLSSAQGATASRSERFQAAGCDRLAFRPKLTLRLKGKTTRSGHPALTTVLKAGKGQANIGRVEVALPHSEFLAQSHIRTICTRVQFADDKCPKGSVYGHATATSPLVDYTFTGPVYLRSSSNPLPDLVLALDGPGATPLEIDAVGRIDSVKGGIRATFAAVPDAPLTKVVLRMPGGKKSLLENSTSLCRRPQRATVLMDGQNGKVYDSRPELKVKCSGAKGKRRG